MPDQIHIESSDIASDHHVLRLTGALVLTTVFQFQAIVRADTSRNLTVDMSNISYVDSAGIGALVNAHVSHSKDGRTFSLRGVNHRVMEVLKITRVDSLFTFLPEEDASAAAR